MANKKNSKTGYDPEMSVLQARTSRLGTSASDDEDEDEDEDEDYEESAMPASILRRVAALKALQEESELHDVEYKKERILLEIKYRLLKEPLLEARAKIVSGEVDVPKSSTDESPEEEAEPLDAPKGIPGYWAQCLVNHPAIEDICSHEDLLAMEALTNITCTYNEDYTSFCLTFFFAENPFFTNEILKKTYTVSPDLLDEKSPTLTGHASSEIEWKPSMNLCVVETKKKQKSKSGKNKGQVRTIVHEEPKQSFFHYFSEPIEDDEEEEEDEEEEQIRIKLTVEEDYDIGHCIRTAVIPESVLWFTGEANGDEDDDEDVDGDGLEDADDDDDDDDDDNKAAGVVRTIAGGFAAAPAAAGAPAQEPECKQN